MPVELTFPYDEINTREPDLDTSADYLELKAFFSENGESATFALDSVKEFVDENEREELDVDITDGRDIVLHTVERIRERIFALEDSYPFQVGQQGKCADIHWQGAMLGSYRLHAFAHPLQCGVIIKNLP